MHSGISPENVRERIFRPSSFVGWNSTFRKKTLESSDHPTSLDCASCDPAEPAPPPHYIQYTREGTECSGRNWTNRLGRLALHRWLNCNKANKCTDAIPDKEDFFVETRMRCERKRVGGVKYDGDIPQHVHLRLSGLHTNTITPSSE